MNTGSWSLRWHRRVGVALAIVGAMAAGDAAAAGALGYYTGAYAMVGEHGCDGADGMGANPVGGCTPGVDALLGAAAFVNGNRGPGNFSQGIADLHSASLVARSVFPDGSANYPGGGANLTDTFTVVGTLSGDVVVTVSMVIDSTITGGGSFDLGFGDLSATLRTANWQGTFSSTYERNGTVNGFDHEVLSRTVTVNDANRVFRVDAFLAVGGGGIPGTHASDASSFVQLSLPNGLSYTSASGVFATAVPEPGATAVMVAGLALLGVWRRCRVPRAVARIA